VSLRWPHVVILSRAKDPVSLLIVFAMAFLATPLFAETVQFRLEQDVGPGIPAEITLIADRAEQPKATQDLTDAFDLARKFHADLDPANPEGTIAKINAKGMKATYVIRPDLANALAGALEVAQQTAGLFDFVSGRDNSLFFKKDFRRVQINTKKHEIFLKAEGVQLNLNPLLPGLLADHIASELTTRGWKNFFISLDGIVLARGRDANGPWKIPVDDLSKRSAKHAFLYEAQDQAAATFVSKSKYKAPDLRGVTLFNESAAKALGYAIAISELGLKQGLFFLGDHPFLKGILVDAQGQFHKVPE